uniref:Uncharacterized protein n=2 Tax=Sus scrofa TaxID=9823 RepID=A0A8D1N2L9_PIG
RAGGDSSSPASRMEPSLHATCSFSGPLPLPWQNRYLWGTGHHMGCLCYQPPHLPPLLTPPPESLPRTPELLAQGPVSLQPPEKHPGALAFIPYFFVLLSMCINY